MAVVTIHKAKTQLSKLLEQALRSEEVIIARGRTPIARLVPYAKEQPKRGFGSMEGRTPRREGFVADSGTLRSKRTYDGCNSRDCPKLKCKLL